VEVVGFAGSEATNEMNQLVNALQLSAVDTKRGLIPHGCSAVSSAGHILAISSTNPYLVNIFSVKRRHNNLTIRWQQTIGPVQPEPISMLVTPNYLLLGERNGLKVYAFQFAPVRMRKATKRPVIGEDQEKKEEEEDKVWSIPVDGILSGLHMATSTLVLASTPTGELFAISLSLLDNPLMEVHKLLPVILPVRFPFKVHKFSIMPPSMRMDPMGSGVLMCIRDKYTVYLMPLREIAKSITAKEESIIEENCEHSPPIPATLTVRHSILLSEPAHLISCVPPDGLIITGPDGMQLFML